MRSLGALCLSVLLWGASPADAPVADAAMRGDTERVQELLRGGADVNVAQGDGMTALHWAAERGDAEMAGMLVYAGANLEAVTRIGDYTALHLGARAGQAAVVTTLAEAGAKIAAVSTAGGATPLHFAAASGSAAAVTALLDHGADVDAREDHWGQTPLIFAAARGRTEAVSVLARRGADVAVTTLVVDVGALSAADRAAGQRRDQILDAFRAEAGPNSEAWRPSPTEVQAAIVAARQTPDAGEAFTADREREVNALRQELGPAEVQQAQDAAMARGVRDGGGQVGGRIGGQGGRAGGQGPGQAAQDGAQYVSQAQAGRQSGGFTSLVGAIGGMTALIHAVREGHAETAFALLDAGADIDQQSAGDATSPLLSAAINGHFDLAIQLIERGADPTLASVAGTTPLFAALNTMWAPKARYPQQQAYQQQNATHVDVMRALLEAGADPDARLTKHLWFMEYTFSHLGIDATGATAFWRATHALDVPAMRLLVEFGADPGTATMKGAERRFRRGGPTEDPSGLAPIPMGGPGVYPIHVASGHGYGTGYAGNSHMHAPDAWMTTLEYLVEEQGADVNSRDQNGYSPLHNAASRGDLEMIRYLVDHGADVMVLSRRGQTTVDMANGPQQRIQPFPEAMALLESLGAINNHNCVSC